MKAEYIEVGKKREYEYKKILLADKGLEKWQLVKKWNSGVDIKKEGSAIVVLLRRRIPKYITCGSCEIRSPEPTEEGECPNCRSGNWVWGDID
jgi:hypothetical protein